MALNISVVFYYELLCNNLPPKDRIHNCSREKQCQIFPPMYLKDTITGYKIYLLALLVYTVGGGDEISLPIYFLITVFISEL